MKNKIVVPKWKQELNATKAALELHKIGMKVTDYENGVQADRKRRLETFKKTGVAYLIDMEESLIEYGEKVISKMKLLNLLKFMKRHEN